MAFDRFLIAPIKSGLMKNSKSWLQPDDAFEYLQNAYVFRDRVRKRFGSQLMGTTPLASRLRVNIGTTNAVTGDLPATNLPGPAALGQIFSVGDVILTIDTVGLGGVFTNTTDISIQGAVNFALNPNTFALSGNSTTNLATVVYWYPSLPVMGIDQYLIDTINNHPTYAFDTLFAYVFSVVGWSRSGNLLFHGTDINYVWTANWQGIAGTKAFFATNFNATLGAGRPTATDDPIWYTLDGTTWIAATGAALGVNGFYFRPSYGTPVIPQPRYTGAFIQTALIIVAFKNRLVLLNTIENDNSSHTGTGTATQFSNRARFSFVGNPFARNAWYEANMSDSSGGVVNNDNIARGGGFIDASTEEAIVSAEFVKDRLIVYFERSTWELAYTGNQVLPFVWNKLNTELGSQATFSTVPFDRDCITIGNSGVHACNGSNTRRIDEKIPDQIFDINTQPSSNIRTHGIRDYYTEMVYWAYVSDTQKSQEVSAKFPDQILVYNYQNGSWAVNDDCFTAFGYFEQQTDLTWESSSPVTWQQFNGTWVSSVLQANQRVILGGTPEGFVLILNAEENRNAPSMYITGMVIAPTGLITLTIIDHNLDSDPTELDYDQDFILIENVVGDLAVETFLNGTVFMVDFVVDRDTIIINTQGGLVAGSYAGGGTAARVSNVQIITKNYNPYVDQNRNVYVAKIDFLVQRTVNGEITIDYYTSDAPISMLDEGVSTGSILGNGILETRPYDSNIYPLEQYQEMLWHPKYFQSSGEFIQILMYFSLEQMLAPAISLAPFELQALCLYTTPTSDRMQ